MSDDTTECIQIHNLLSNSFSLYTASTPDSAIKWQPTIGMLVLPPSTRRVGPGGCLVCREAGTHSQASGRPYGGGGGSRRGGCGGAVIGTKLLPAPPFLVMVVALVRSSCVA